MFIRKRITDRKGNNIDASPVLKTYETNDDLIDSSFFFFVCLLHLKSCLSKMLSLFPDIVVPVPIVLSLLCGWYSRVS